MKSTDTKQSRMDATMKLDFTYVPGPKEWMVIHTKSRREKKVAQFCDANGITHYLPLEERIHKYDRKKVVNQAPLFPGYLFCLCDNKHRYRLLMTHQIARILPVKNQQSFIKDIEKIYIAQHGHFNPKSCEYATIGNRMRIIAGPLKGQEGIVMRTKGKQRLILNIDFISQAASIEIEHNCLTPA